MITRNFEITLRIPEQGYIPMCFDVVQNDKDVYSLTVHITDGLDEIEYTQISSATVTFAKADGKVVQGDMTVGTDSLTYTMGTNEISYPGQVLASIQLFGASGERLTTARFRFNVVADLITEDAVKSTSEFAILQRLKEELEAIDVVDLTNQFNAHKAESATQEKAGHIKLQEPWITATLQNGWTGTLQYAKNDLGQLLIKGEITPGTITKGTIIAKLPTGYRPINITETIIPVFESYIGRGVLGITLINNGNIVVYSPADTILTDKTIGINVVLSNI